MDHRLVYVHTFPICMGLAVRSAARVEGVRAEVARCVFECDEDAGTYLAVSLRNPGGKTQGTCALDFAGGSAAFESNLRRKCEFRTAPRPGAIHQARLRRGRLPAHIAAKQQRVRITRRLRHIFNLKLRENIQMFTVTATTIPGVSTRVLTFLPKSTTLPGLPGLTSSHLPALPTASLPSFALPTAVGIMGKGGEGHC